MKRSELRDCFLFAHRSLTHANRKVDECWFKLHVVYVVCVLSERSTPEDLS